MKVVLINAAFNRYGGIKGHGGSMIPLNLCYLASYARREHPDSEFKILDAEALGISHEETVEITARFAPNLIGVTTNTCVFDSVIALTKLIKTRLSKVPIILGGPHVSALPERSLEESKADFIAIGEGERTFEELLTHLKAERNDWSKINGLAYREKDGEVRVNAPRELIQDLDFIPFPARDLVNNDLYTPPPTKRVSLGANTILATSRGCPYNCGFCAAKTIWTKKYRARKPESVLSEIEECVDRYGIRSFNFTDEFFTANRKRVLEICRQVCERKLNIAWVCSSRAQHLDIDMLEAMKAAGCHEISFGIESGNPEILKRIDKALNLEEAQDVIRLTKKVGIITHASYILGYLGETEETIKDTIRFAKKLNTQVAAFFVASPLPGTSLYKEAKANGYIRPDATWFDYSPLANAEPVMALPNLSTTELKRWHRRALRSYYFRPKYIISRLLRIRHLYEIVNLFVGMVMFFRIKK